MEHDNVNKNCPHHATPHCAHKWHGGCPDGCAVYWCLVETGRVRQEPASPAEKPPLGVKPRWLHDKARLLDVLAAIARYVEASKPLPLEWVEEMADLMDRYCKEAKKRGEHD